MKHWDPAERDKSSTRDLAAFTKTFWCTRVFYSLQAFKNSLKSNFVFKLSRHFQLAEPLYLSTLEPPVNWLSLALQCTCNFLLTGTCLRKVNGPYATSCKLGTSFKPERVTRSCLVLHVTHTPGFYLAVLGLSAIVFHWGGRTWVPFIKSVWFSCRKSVIRDNLHLPVSCYHREAAILRAGFQAGWEKSGVFPNQISL